MPPQPNSPRGASLSQRLSEAVRTEKPSPKPVPWRISSPMEMALIAAGSWLVLMSLTLSVLRYCLPCKVPPLAIIWRKRA